MVGWLLLSFIISPLLAALILYLINPSKEFKKGPGLIYLIILFGLIALLVAGVMQIPDGFSGSGSSKSTYEVSQSSQAGSVCLLSFGVESWEYTVQVQNNTDREIKRTDFRIIYYDQEGNQIDYRDKTSHEPVDAHMTKTVRLNKGIDVPKHFGKATIKITNYSYVSSFDY